MAQVDCQGCTACCRGPDRELTLDRLDNPDDFLTYTLDGKVFLARKPNHDCVYLTDEGCSIYERRPIVCRKFDCRELIHHPGTPFRVWIAAMDRM